MTKYIAAYEGGRGLVVIGFGNWNDQVFDTPEIVEEAIEGLGEELLSLDYNEDQVEEILASAKVYKLVPVSKKGGEKE